MAGLQERHAEFREHDIDVVAVSADGNEDAARMVEDEGLEFPVLHGADVEEMKDRLGLYIHDNERTHLQPAQFILDDGGKVGLACYSSGPVGRLDAGEALEMAKRVAKG